MHGGFLITFVQHAQPIHYNLEVQANPQKNGTKKPMLFLASMGETGLSHDIFFKFSVGPNEESSKDNNILTFEQTGSNSRIS